jgi:signal transduction histidine kinase
MAGQELLRKIKAFKRRHWLWVSLIALPLPLIIILYVQYQSLRTLEQMLPGYHQARLERFLAEVIREVQGLYFNHAEAALSLPVSAIPVTDSLRRQKPAALERAAEHFQQQPAFPGVRRYFLVVASGVGGFADHTVLFYDAPRRTLAPDAQAPELRAINVAVAPYLIYIRNGAVILPQLDGVDRDSDYPLLLKPALDSERRVIAVAGCVLDQPWFKDVAVPGAVSRILPRSLPNKARDATVTLSLDAPEQVLYSDPPGEYQPVEAMQRFTGLAPRRLLGIRMRGETVEQWARRNFLLTLALSLLMKLVIIGGLLLSLRVAARELKLSQMKTDFVANLSHEFRTPLSSILALAELMRLRRVKDMNEAQEFGEYIDSQGRRLMQLINNVLDFSRIESGRKDFHFEQADVREVVNEAIEACAGRLKQSGHTIRLETAPSPPPLLRLDRDALALALTNLLDNAMKYSRQAGEIVVRLSHTGNSVEIAVIDQGIGIAREERRRIFEKFYRVSAGLVHDVKGSGLGLAIVEHIVRAHQGRITVESELGRGSAFTIHLPAPAFAPASSENAGQGGILSHEFSAPQGVARDMNDSSDKQRENDAKNIAG